MVSAAEAPFRAMMSYGLISSTDNTVATMWVSLRKPSRKLGRSGRSINRQVRMAFSVGRPSRRKNDPGILPAAYIRSSRSTVSGKKSAPSRSLRLAVAVVRTSVAPMAATTAPSACWARVPARNSISTPPTAPRTMWVCTLCSLLVLGGERANYQWSHLEAIERWQLATGSAPPWIAAGDRSERTMRTNDGRPVAARLPSA